MDQFQMDINYLSQLQIIYKIDSLVQLRVDVFPLISHRDNAHSSRLPQVL